MGIQTIEDLFAVKTSKIMEKTAASAAVVSLLTENTHLWPFYCHPGPNQEFAEPLGKTLDVTVDAFVYRGRWICRCPFCPSAQDASTIDPWFFCADCTNSSVGNKSIPVLFPEHQEMIEKLLLERPFVNTRNWLPNETVADLLMENQEHLYGMANS